MTTRHIPNNRKNGASAQRIQGLTAQQQMFVKHLLASKSFSPTEAAREAGYKFPSQMGNQLLKNAVVRAAVGKELTERRERLEWDGDEVLEMLRTVINLDITELYDEAGNISMERLKAMPEHHRKCVTEVRTTRKFMTNEMGEREYYNQVEVKWMDKNQAMHLALKHFGLLNDDLRVQVMDEEMKRKLIVDLMGQLSDESKAGRGGHIVDATVIASRAEETT